MLILLNCKQSTKYQIPPLIFFQLSTLFNALYFEAVSGTLRDMCINISKVQTKCSHISPAIQYYHATSTIHLFMPYKCIWDSRRKYESIYRSCINHQYLQIEVIKTTNLDMSGYYDTLTDEDIVRKQYSLLPYPRVTREGLEREKMYYNAIKFITK